MRGSAAITRINNILTHDSNVKNIQECKMPLQQSQKAEVRSRRELGPWKAVVFSEPWAVQGTMWGLESWAPKSSMMQSSTRCGPWMVNSGREVSGIGPQNAAAQRSHYCGETNGVRRCSPNSRKEMLKCICGLLISVCMCTCLYVLRFMYAYVHVSVCMCLWRSMYTCVHRHMEARGQH